MGIKTYNFTDTVAKNFLELLREGETYLFGSDYSASTTTLNARKSLQDVLEKTIFGVKIQDADTAMMITDNVWTPGIVYQMYDDRDSLSGTNFYVIVEPDEVTGDYHVFKCLFNNNGGISTNKPLYVETINETGGESNLADGYIWKYLYSMSYTAVKKFKTQGYFPIGANEETAELAAPGIHVILVENFTENFGYEKVTGAIDSLPDNTGRIILTISDSSSFNESVNIYQGMAFYVTKEETDESIGSRQYTIGGSGRVGLSYYVDIIGYDPEDTDFIIERFDQFSILPRVVINGTGENAEGIAIFDSTNTRINSIQMISRGDDYSAASASIIDPAYFNVNAGDVRAILRPIISPREGHGSNFARELRSDAVCISTVITDFSTNVPAKNTYSKIALVQDPTITGNPATFDNRVKLTVASVSTAAVGDRVSQPNGVSGIIHEIDGTDVYVVNYLGEYSETFNQALPLTIGSVNINISDVDFSPYTQRSGVVLHVSDFEPIERDSEKREVVKILLDF